MCTPANGSAVKTPATTKLKRASKRVWKTSPHRLLPQIDHHDNQYDRTELFDQHQPEIGCVQRASEDQAEQQRDHRHAKQHHQPPANDEPPTKHPCKQRPRQPARR
jgi:hypothetical protein